MRFQPSSLSFYGATEVPVNNYVYKEADGRAVAYGSDPYKAILKEVAAVPAANSLSKGSKVVNGKAVTFRDVAGSGGYVYRHYSDGRIYIQMTGYTGDTKTTTTTTPTTTGTKYYLPLQQQNIQPTTPNGATPTTTSGADAIKAQIKKYYGPFPANIKFREVAGVVGSTPLATSATAMPGSYKDGYIYREYADGRVFIQSSGETAGGGGGGGGGTRTSGGGGGGGGTGTTGGDKEPTILPPEKKTEGDQNKDQGMDWKKIALIAVPSVLILGVGAYFLFSGGGNTSDSGQAE